MYDERPFDYSSSPSFEPCNSAYYLTKVASCRRMIVEYRAKGRPDLARSFREHWEGNMRIARQYRAQEHERQLHRWPPRP